jgi:hypothetical protein
VRDFTYLDKVDDWIGPYVNNWVCHWNSCFGGAYFKLLIVRTRWLFFIKFVIMKALSRPRVKLFREGILVQNLR